MGRIKSVSTPPNVPMGRLMLLWSAKDKTEKALGTVPNAFFMQYEYSRNLLLTP